MTQVSVLMAVHNGETYLREALDSILQQKLSDLEFIIINDGSTDRSAEIARSYDDPRIRYFENAQNMGLIRCLNRGLSLARSPYVARMDADDISLPERLAKQVEFLDAHPDVGVLGCGAQVIDAHGKKCRTWRYPAEHGVLRWSLCFHDPIVHPTVMMRREVVDRVGGYSSDMVHAEDYDLWRRLSGLTRLSNLQGVLLYYREHEASVTGMSFVEQWQNSIRVSQLMISEFLGAVVPITTVQRLWSREFETSNDLCETSSLIYRLYEANVADRGLSTSDKRLIRRDAARRMFGVALRRIGDVRAWAVVGLACRLDPFVGGKAATGQVRRILRERLLC